MKQQSQNVLEVLALFLTGLILIVFFLPVMTTRCGPNSIGRCQNNLRSIGIAMILYSNDYRYMPHMKPHDKEHDESDISKVYRTLYALKYLDDLESFVCLGSKGVSIEREDKVLQNPKLFQWGHKGPAADETLPIHGGKDPSVFDNPELSFTYRRKAKLGATLLSISRLATDKSRPAEGQPEHRGMNVLYGDGHVSFVTKRDSEFKKLSSELLLKKLSPKK